LSKSSLLMPFLRKSASSTSGGAPSERNMP
jgi:hypothetical protein